ncbi:MAG TPA: hypothetical protein VL484_00890 [Vicinamibacterales bacterium]|nr:hypothetical protein [Vicinamibacterales bacterium]
MNGIVQVSSGGGTRTVPLSAYLRADAEERAQTDARDWIKALRSIPIDGRSMRDRFTSGDDSLWWFSELYLHKEQAVLTAMRTLAALDALIEREQPAALSWRSGDAVTHWVACARASRHGLRLECEAAAAELRTLERRLRARAHTLRLTDARGGAGRRLRRATVAAFVHRAFVNAPEGAAAGERYIGRVLTAIESGLPPGDLQVIVVGPRRSFRNRRWWDPVTGSDEGLVPIESIGIGRSPMDREVWASRHRHLEALEASEPLRRHAIIDGTDCWPVIRAQLVGVIWLQWPWSVRAMDRAGAALDAIAPRVALTYAEAGGWGRALALEARRRSVPLVGIQHGFIYRHWLNYIHAPDELEPSRAHPADRGFPRPALTLVFDRYAEQHLRMRAHFPPEAIKVVGSAERDALIATARSLTSADRASLRRHLGVASDRPIVLCATKFTEARDVLPALSGAIRALPHVHMIIKAHPAETTDGYTPFVAENISVVPAGEALADLLAVTDVVATVNSTVAVDALALGVPAVSIGQPNNLSPFVEAGAMLGADTEGAIASALTRLLSDQHLRADVIRKGRALIGADVDGAATENAATAVLALATRTADPEARPC